MKNAITSALIWTADDFNNNLENLRTRDEINEEPFSELMKMSDEDKVKQLELYIGYHQDQIIEIINDIIIESMMDDYAINQ
jgi:hypothetical protein